MERKYSKEELWQAFRNGNDAACMEHENINDYFNDWFDNQFKSNDQVTERSEEIKILGKRKFKFTFYDMSETSEEVEYDERSLFEVMNAYFQASGGLRYIKFRNCAIVSDEAFKLIILDENKPTPSVSIVDVEKEIIIQSQVDSVSAGYDGTKFQTTFEEGFLKCYEYIKSKFAKSILASDTWEWISVESEMPNLWKNRYVLAYTPNEINKITSECVYNDGKGGFCFMRGKNKGDTLEITHWMPLPQSPSLFSSNKENKTEVVGAEVCRFCKSPNIIDNEQYTDCRDCGQSFI